MTIYFRIAQNRIINLKTEEKPTRTAIVQEEYLLNFFV